MPQLTPRARLISPPESLDKRTVRVDRARERMDRCLLATDLMVVDMGNHLFLLDDAVHPRRATLLGDRFFTQLTLLSTSVFLHLKETAIKNLWTRRGAGNPAPPITGYIASMPLTALPRCDLHFSRSFADMASFAIVGSFDASIFFASSEI